MVKAFARVGWATIAARVASIVPVVLAGGISWSPCFKRVAELDRRAVPEHLRRCLLRFDLLLESLSAVRAVPLDKARSDRRKGVTKMTMVTVHVVPAVSLSKSA